MITTRTLDAITILDLHGPLGAGQQDAALRQAIRVAFEGGATTVILNMRDVPVDRLVGRRRAGLRVT